MTNHVANCGTFCDGAPGSCCKRRNGQAPGFQSTINGAPMLVAFWLLCGWDVIQGDNMRSPFPDVAARWRWGRPGSRGPLSGPVPVRFGARHFDGSWDPGKSQHFVNRSYFD